MIAIRQNHLDCMQLFTCSIWIMTSILPINLIFRAVTVFIRMHLAVILKRYGHWRKETKQEVCDLLDISHQTTSL